MTKDENLEEMLTDLAKSIIRDVEGRDVEIRMDALKACTTLHLGLVKTSGKDAKEAVSDTGLPAFKKRVEEAAQGAK